VPENSNHLLKVKQKIIQPLHSLLLELPEPCQLARSSVTSQGSVNDVKEDNRKLSTRCSPRIQSKIKKKKPTVKLAQEALAKKWEILDVEKEIEELILQQYIDIYKKPLSQPAIMAMKKLTEVAEMKKKKKREATKKKKKIRSGSTSTQAEEDTTAA
jgi:hypothetical protein